MDRLKVIKSHLSPLINPKEFNSVIFLTINRPKTLNSFNFEIVLTIISYMEKARVSKSHIIVTGEAKKYLGSGGDLVLTTEKIQEIPEFMRCLHHMFYLTSKVKSISLWTGYVIGASAGLACSSVTKVAFPSSKYLMPETEIGLFPNVGGSYFLSHHLPQHIGLYLGLTGHTLKGADCFLYGLCQFFVLDEDYDALVNELFLGNPLKTLEKFHREPLWQWSELKNFEDEIRENFLGKKNVEEIFKSLQQKTTPWAVKTLKKLEKRCPLSLKVAFKAFYSAAKKTFRESLEMEFSIELSMMIHYRYNFLNGVRAKLMKKEFQDWMPAYLEDITEEMLEELFNNRDGLKLDLRFLDN